MSWATFLLFRGNRYPPGVKFKGDLVLGQMQIFLLRTFDFVEHLDCKVVFEKGVSLQNLMQVLGKFESLRTLSLDLSDSHITVSDAQFLAQLRGFGLENLTLNLSNQQIGDVGVQALVFGLIGNSSLRFLTLNLTDSFITDVGAKTLVDGLKELEQLDYLDLNFSSNQIVVQNSEVLSSLKSMQVLKVLRLDLTGNVIGLEELQNLVGLLRAVQQKYGTTEIKGVDGLDKPIDAIGEGAHFQSAESDLAKVVEQSGDSKTAIQNRKRSKAYIRQSSPLSLNVLSQRWKNPFISQF